MINLILAILASSIIAVLMRFSKNFVKNKMLMFCANYFICMLASIFFIKEIPTSNLISFPIWFGIISGVLYLASFLFFEFNIRKNGVVLSSTFMKLGVLVPILISVIFYHEIPNTFKIIGIILSLIGIIIMNFKLNEKTSFNALSLMLILLLIINGFTDATSTIFKHTSNINYEGFYLFIVFLSAFIISSLIFIFKRNKFSKYDIIFGLLIGIPNYFSSLFLLNALNDVSAIIVYPTFSISTIVIISLVGIIFFKEKLSLKEVLGLVVIITAIVFLNIAI